MGARTSVLKAGRLTLDRDDQRVWLDQQVIDVGPKPFALLLALMLSPQRLVTKEELIETVWEGRFVSEAVLTTAMRDLRRALGDDARQPTFIATAHGRGYRFLLPVTEDATPASGPSPAPPVDTPSPTPAAKPRPRLSRFSALAIAGLLACLVAAWTLVKVTAPGASTATASIAVLPFEDLSASGDRAYFTDGVAEEILNVLMGVEGLSVVSRTSSFAYKQRDDITTPTIARELGVGYVLEGSVRTTDTQVRVNVRLVDATTGRTRWTRTYERRLSTQDLLAIQDEIARRVVAELRDQLNTPLSAHNTQARSAAAGTESMQAYELYLHARSLFVTRTDLPRAIRFARDAANADPHFARAWELLAAATFAKDGRPSDEAWEAVNTALRLDENLSLAHALKGVMSNYPAPYDWDGAIEELETAITLDPTNTTALLWLGVELHKLGYLERSQTMLERCIAIDGAYDRCRQHLMWVLHMRGRTDDAIRQYGTLLRTDANFNDAALLLAFIRRGDQAAVTQIVSSLEHQDPLPPIVLAALREPARTDRAAAQRALRDWLTSSNFNKRKVFSITLALGVYDQIYTGQGSLFPLWLPEFPEYRRSDAFRAFVREMNIDDYWRAHGFPPQCRPVGAQDFNCA